MSLLLSASMIKYRYGGSYEILMSKLGQELIDDVHCVQSMCDILKQHTGNLKTHAGRLLANKVLDELHDFKNVPTLQQWHLRDLCRAQNLDVRWTCTPTWANGAVVLCIASDASEIRDTLRDVALRKGDVVVSSSLADFVRGIIESRHSIPGDSERPYRKQQPRLKVGTRSIERQPLSAVVASEIREQLGRARSSPPRLRGGPEDISDRASCLPRGTHTTGSLPSNPHTKGRDYGVHRKKFKLTQLASFENASQEAPPSADDMLEAAEGLASFPGSGSAAIAASETTELSLLTDDGQWMPDVAELIHDFCEEHAPPQPLSEPEFLERVAERAICLVHIFERVLEVPAAHEKVSSCYKVDASHRGSHIEVLAALHRHFCERIRRCFCKSNLAPFVQTQGDFEAKSAKVAALFPDQLKRAFKKKSRADALALPKRIPATLDFTSPEQLTDLVREGVSDAAKAALGEAIKDVLGNVMTKNEENNERLTGIAAIIAQVLKLCLMTMEMGKGKWDRSTREMFRGQRQIQDQFLARKR